MDSITVSNFRCFGAMQTARLAPITLLVGENSTGKTSLMAIIRALWDATHGDRVPNFKEEPYDLGSFDEIVHNSGARGGRPASFSAAFEMSTTREDDSNGQYNIEVEFVAEHASPFPRRRKLSHENVWLEQNYAGLEHSSVSIGTARGEWTFSEHNPYNLVDPKGVGDILMPLSLTLAFYRPFLDRTLSADENDPFDSGPKLEETDIDDIQRLIELYSTDHRFSFASDYYGRPFGSAPIRSQPKRTYDPARVSLDAEGTNVPSRLALLSLFERDEWAKLKHGIETFGSSAGLFDEIRIRHLGKTASAPFQIQVRKYGKRRKGPLHNLADVGYGVSQVLPLVTDLLREDGPEVMLIQQPEVHLHPSAEAALGSLLCDVVDTSDRSTRLIVETHSDFIIDRIRTSVRDESSNIRPDDIAIIFFERRGLEVNLHSLGVDDNGSIIGAPDGYRRFFLDELQRSMRSS